MRLQELARAVGGKLHGVDAMFAGVSTDTRTLREGELFVALEGPNFNGHRFLAEAQQKQAVAAMVCRREALSLPQVTVGDTRLGLGALAHYWRRKFHCPVVAITGSNGKTTVKEMTGAILRNLGQVLVSQGNLNNDIGLPLVLCRLRNEHAYAVVEMGMSQGGEIDYLTRLAQPQVAVITNAAAAHLEGLGSLDAIAEAKAEIFNGLSEDGVAIVNAEDAYAALWRQRAQGHPCITFGMEFADVSVSRLRTEDGKSHVELNTPQGSCEFTLRLPGRHNVLNALAASAAALAAGAEPDQIRQGLESMAPVSGRLQTRVGLKKATVIDDTYNANPASMSAAIRVLAATHGKKILVVGDMLELGAEGKALHMAVGKEARAAKIDQLLCLGTLSEGAAHEFGPNARHFHSKSALIEVLRASIDANTTVLVKGSRGMQMEKIVSAICSGEMLH